MRWEPAADEKDFQVLIDGPDALGSVILEDGQWRAYAPIGKPVGISPDKDVAKNIVEQTVVKHA